MRLTRVQFGQMSGRIDAKNGVETKEETDLNSGCEIDGRNSTSRRGLSFSLTG